MEPAKNDMIRVKSKNYQEECFSRRIFMEELNTKIGVLRRIFDNKWRKMN
jgi:hypothetical protein